MSEGRYLSAAEVAKRYGLTVQWVYGCRSLPRRKVGKYLRFLESDLEVWEKRHVDSYKTFGFHIFENTKEIQHHHDFHKHSSHNSTLYREGNFALLFDILP